MLFYILISVIFIAELIIAGEIIKYLVKSRQAIAKYNVFFDELKPRLKGLMETLRKISEQLTELAPMFVNYLKTMFTNFLIGRLKNLLTGIIFIAVKKEVEKRLS